MMRTITSCLLMLFMLSADAATATIRPADDPSLNVTMSDGGTASMSWTSFGTSGNYTVTVTDLTTGRQVTEFATANTSSTITGLSNGHSIEFKVSRDGIIIDVVLGS